jgi:hypothetical protein
MDTPVEPPIFEADDVEEVVLSPVVDGNLTCTFCGTTYDTSTVFLRHAARRQQICTNCIQGLWHGLHYAYQTITRLPNQALH